MRFIHRHPGKRSSCHAARQPVTSPSACSGMFHHACQPAPPRATSALMSTLHACPQLLCGLFHLCTCVPRVGLLIFETKSLWPMAVSGPSPRRLQAPVHQAPAGTVTTPPT